MSHNQPPKHNKLKKAAVLTLLTAVGAGATVGTVNYVKAEAKKNAAIDRQLETIIDPEIDARGREALAEYNAQPDKDNGDIHLSVDTEDGVARITGHAENPISVGGQNFGYTRSDMEVVMGLLGGVPNPDDTRYAWYKIGTNADGRISVQELQLTAPGAEGYRSGTLPGDDSDGWSAAYGIAGSFGGGAVKGGQTSTDERRAWAGDPHPLPPEDSARKVISEVGDLVPKVFDELTQ